MPESLVNYCNGIRVYHALQIAGYRDCVVS